MYPQVLYRQWLGPRQYGKANEPLKPVNARTFILQGAFQFIESPVCSGAFLGNRWPKSAWSSLGVSPNQTNLTDKNIRATVSTSGTSAERDAPTRPASLRLLPGSRAHHLPVRWEDWQREMHDLGSAHKLPARPQTVTPGSTRGSTRKRMIVRREFQMHPRIRPGHSHTQKPPPVVVEGVPALPLPVPEGLCPVSPGFQPRVSMHPRTRPGHSRTETPTSVGPAHCGRTYAGWGDCPSVVAEGVPALPSSVREGLTL